MPRFPGQALRLGVSASAVCLLRTSRWRGAPFAVLAEHPIDPAPPLAEALGAALASLFAPQAGAPALAGWPLSIVLDQSLCRLWQVTPPAGASRLADLEAAAGLRFHSLYGESPAAWQLSADWQASERFLAAAMPRALLKVLLDCAGAQRLTVATLAPHFILSWNRWQHALQPDAWFGLLHDGVLTVAAIDSKGLQAVRALGLPAQADAAWLQQALAREALLLGLDLPARLQICGKLPPAWTAAPAGGQTVCSALASGRHAGLSDLSISATLALAGSRV